MGYYYIDKSKNLYTQLLRFIGTLKFKNLNNLLKVIFMICNDCGNPISENAAICVKCGVQTENVILAQGSSNKSRLTYVLLGFFLGALGIHNFYAGYTGRAVVQLLITIFLGWLIIPWLAVEFWSLIDIIFIKKDANAVKFS